MVAEIRRRKSPAVGQISVMLHAPRGDNEISGAKVPAVKENLL
jgi:hypothetical protein